MRGKTKQCVGEMPKKLGKNDKLQENCKLNKLKKKKKTLTQRWETVLHWLPKLKVLNT